MTLSSVATLIPSTSGRDEQVGEHVRAVGDAARRLVEIEEDQGKARTRDRGMVVEDEPVAGPEGPGRRSAGGPEGRRRRGPPPARPSPGRRRSPRPVRSRRETPRPRRSRSAVTGQRLLPVEQHVGPLLAGERRAPVPCAPRRRPRRSARLASASANRACASRSSRPARSNGTGTAGINLPTEFLGEHRSLLPTPPLPPFDYDREPSRLKTADHFGTRKMDDLQGACLTSHAQRSHSY